MKEAPGRRRPSSRSRPRLAASRRRADRLLFEHPQASLMDLVDNILNKGLTITGDVVLSLADVDLVYLRLSALLCAADRVLPGARIPAGALPAARKR